MQPPFWGNIDGTVLLCKVPTMLHVQFLVDATNTKEAELYTVLWHFVSHGQQRRTNSPSKHVIE